jgi:hypothetical protein
MTAECEGWLCWRKKWIARLNGGVIKVNFEEQKPGRCASVTCLLRRLWRTCQVSKRFAFSFQRSAFSVQRFAFCV